MGHAVDDEPQRKPRARTLRIAGFGVETAPRIPAAISHLMDGSLIFGPQDLAAARIPGAKHALLRPGRTPTAALERRSIAEGGQVTYSSAERGTTQLVLGTGMQSYDDLLDDLRTADHPAYWTILTDDHEVRWPTWFTLFIDDGTSRGRPYELALGRSSTNRLFLEPALPTSLTPDGQQLITFEHELVGAGSLIGALGSVKWIDLVHSRLMRRCYYLPQGRYMLQAYATRDDAMMVFAAADLVASTFRPKGTVAT
jgi:hypothetical protein